MLSLDGLSRRRNSLGASSVNNNIRHFACAERNHPNNSCSGQSASSIVVVAPLTLMLRWFYGDSSSSKQTLLLTPLCPLLLSLSPLPRFCLFAFLPAGPPVWKHKDKCSFANNLPSLNQRNTDRLVRKRQRGAQRKPLGWRARSSSHSNRQTHSTYYEGGHFSFLIPMISQPTFLR